MYQKESLVFYGDLVSKLRRVKGEANFISSGSKIVKYLRCLYDIEIIERTIGLVHDPLTAVYRSFLKVREPLKHTILYLKQGIG